MANVMNVITLVFNFIFVELIYQSMLKRITGNLDPILTIFLSKYYLGNQNVSVPFDQLLNNSTYCKNDSDKVKALSIWKEAVQSTTLWL